LRSVAQEIVLMPVSALSSPGSHAASQQAVQSLASHKHGGRHWHSISDIDAQSSSIASPPSASGKIGTKLDITA